MIAVITIIAIVAVTALPFLIKHIDLAARNAETANLASIRDALELQVVRNRVIPDHSSWQQAVANWSSLPLSRVSTNDRGYNRIYFLQTGPTPSLIYTQASTGTIQPAKLRAIVVSTLGGNRLDASNCPSPSGGNLSDSDFNSLWNTTDRSRPSSGLWANWNGSGEDFLTQRIDYTPQFHHLVLINRDTNFSATFTINGSSYIRVTNSVNNAGWDSYYLDGTLVGLCDASGTPMTCCVLSHDISYVFESGIWRGQILGTSTANSMSDNFGQKAAAFLAAQWYPGSHQGGDQQGVLTAMYSFMYTYTLWANQCPHFPWHSSSSLIQVPEYELMNDVGANNKRLDEFSGQNGLLK